MTLHWPGTSRTMAPASRRAGAAARLTARRVRGAGRNRTLLAGPSVYTVTDTTDNPNDAGSLRAIVNTANNDPNPAGSIIQFNPTDFSGAHTITLGSPLTLSETPGPEVIEGPGARSSSWAADRGTS